MQDPSARSLVSLPPSIGMTRLVLFSETRSTAQLWLCLRRSLRVTRGKRTRRTQDDMGVLFSETRSTAQLWLCLRRSLRVTRKVFVFRDPSARTATPRLLRMTRRKANAPLPSFVPNDTFPPKGKARICTRAPRSLFSSSIYHFTFYILHSTPPSPPKIPANFLSRPCPAPFFAVWDKSGTAFRPFFLAFSLPPCYNARKKQGENAC